MTSRIEVKIDYINCTWRGERGTLLGETDGKRGRGFLGYDESFQTDIAMYQYSDKGSKQGHMVTLAGQALDALRRGMDCNEHEFLPLFEGLKCTRIDVALDAYDCTLTAKGLEKLWLDGLIKPRAKQGTIIADSLGERGDTFYLGSLESRSGKLFRGYEKSKKEGDQLSRFRMELQLGSEGGANDCLQSLLALPSQTSIEHEMHGIISGYLKPVSYDNEVGKLLSTNLVSYKIANKHATNRRKWLESQVLPALKEEMDSDIEFYNNVVKYLCDT